MPGLISTDWVIWLKTSIKKILYPFRANHGPLDAFAASVYGMALSNRGEYQPLFTYIAMFDVIRQHGIRGKGLELGGGYSTVLLLEFVENEQFSLESIDMNPGKYSYVLPSKKIREYLFEKITISKRITVSFEELLNSYKVLLPERIKKIGIDKFNANLKKFISIDRAADDCLFHPDKIGDHIVSSEGFDVEKRFYTDNKMMIGAGYCKELNIKEIKYDFIFFDCGESSSLAEWFILETNISDNGYVFLHDVFYPKSIKNFIVAALILSSPEWSVIYVDKYSPQGGLVARRNACE
jgi:hypothetical protein